jgi:hypothetical protein
VKHMYILIGTKKEVGDLITVGMYMCFRLYI